MTVKSWTGLRATRVDVWSTFAQLDEDEHFPESSSLAPWRTSSARRRRRRCSSVCLAFVCPSHVATSKTSASKRWRG